MRSRIPLLVALALTGCGSESDKPSGPEPPIVDGATTLAFADSALQVAVDEAVAGTSGVLVALSASGRGITDLGGIEQLTQLETLDLAHNAIRDLSPLAGLRQLRLLDLGNNQIEEVSPLRSLEQLQVLILAHNAVQDLAAIMELDSLHSVELTGNPLSGAAVAAQIAALRNRGVTVGFGTPDDGVDEPSGPESSIVDGWVTGTFADSALQVAVDEAEASTSGALVALSANGRGIADLRGIEQLTQLEALDLAHNAIRDLSPLTELRQLRFLDLAHNAVQDLAAILELDSLHSVDLLGNPLSGATAKAQIVALRNRGVTVRVLTPDAGVVTPDDRVVSLGERQIVFSSNRRTEAHYLRGREVYSLDLETGEVVNLSAELAAVPFADGSRPDTTELFSLAHRIAREGEEPTLSPDRTRVAFVSYRDGNYEIYVMGADGSAPTNITQHDAWDSSPAWSPDGRRIAFVSDRNGDRYNGDIFLMNADGTGVEQLTFEAGNGAGQLAWSPDGSSIAFVSGRDGPLAIFAIELASGDIRRISNNDLSVSSPSWSPDGAWIAYIESQDELDESSHVWVMAADGNEARQLTFGNFWEQSPTWSPDGTHIAFGRIVDMETRYDIYMIPLDGGPEERVTDDPYDDMDPSWMPF
ncbi:MAG: leucine-rich repeat domain-containing protein [Gemmatimonadetes bacterium]|nr:leucine-rich repeat domain-containing protein [Gemmatimonadota bacterium]